MGAGGSRRIIALCLALALLLMAGGAWAQTWELEEYSQNFCDNPLRGGSFDTLTVEYTISWSASSQRSGWNTVLSFSNADRGAYVAFLSNPALCTGGGARYGQPGSGADCAPFCQPGTRYTFKWVIGASGVAVYQDGARVASWPGGADIIAQVKALDFFFVGVGSGGHSSAWPTERCTVSNVRLNGRAVGF